MKAFWDTFFDDMDERGMDRESAAMKGGAAIRESLREIEDAIRNYNLREAFEVIDDLKERY